MSDGVIRYLPSDREELFWSRGRRTEDGCLEWMGARHRWGYGVFRIQPCVITAHRLALILTQGDLGGLEACHKCHNPPCFEPTHLYAGTHAQNMRDMSVRGSNAGERAGQAKLTEADVIAIRNSVESNPVLAIRYGVTPQTIGKIRLYRSWKHVA